MSMATTHAKLSLWLVPSPDEESSHQDSSRLKLCTNTGATARLVPPVVISATSGSSGERVMRLT